MRSDITPIVLTLQDILGALLPGMVWAVEFLTLNQIAEEYFQGAGAKITAGVLYPSTFQMALSLVSDQTTAFYTGFVICSLILGFITNVFPTALSEFISFPAFKAIRFIFRIGARSASCAQCGEPFREKERFPYNDIFLGKSGPFRPSVSTFLEENFAKELDAFPMDYQTSCFNMCKKFLRFDAKEHIRDRLMYIEAQNRMLSSLLLASITNILLVLSALCLAGGENRNSLFAWLVVSAVITLVISYAFQYRRHTEVSAVYTYVVYHLREDAAQAKKETGEVPRPPG